MATIWALADLHLPGRDNKPMDIFGPEWKDHPDRIMQGWQSNIKDHDLTIIPGDISWAMQLEGARDDLNWIAALPGRKVLVRGNHDYWWKSISRVRAALPPGMWAIQNDHCFFQGWAICGTRGWICPEDSRFDPERDEKIYLREVQRLELSLKSAHDRGHRQIIVSLHFPPFNVERKPSGFTELLDAYEVRICIYGHLHAEARELAFEGELGKTRYIFVAADHLDFVPTPIVTDTGDRAGQE